MKNTKRFLGLLLALVVLAVSLAVPAGAVEHRYYENDKVAGTDAYLKEINGGSFKFKKFLVIPDGTKVPNAEFEFSIETTGGINYTGSTMAIYSTKPADGYVVGEPTWTKNKATFAPTDTTYTTVRNDGTADKDIDVKRTAADRNSSLNAATGVQWEEGKEVYAVVEDLEIDFSGVTFKEPGIYRYIIRETASATNENAGIMHDNHTFRVLDVYVTDTNNKPTAQAYPEGELHVGLYDDQHSSGKTITGYVLHKGARNAGAWVEKGTVANNADKGSADVAVHGAELTDKTDGFTNEYKPYTLVFKKEVYGNQASRDKFFEFTVKLTNVKDEDKFEVSIADDGDTDTVDGYANEACGTNAATTVSGNNYGSKEAGKLYVTGAQLKAGHKFYLQHGQYIAIRGLPANATYTVDEKPEDYKKVVAGSEQAMYKTIADFQNVTTGVLSEQDAMLRSNGTEADNAPDHVVYTSILNVRDGIIPTGILTVIGPAVAVILLAVAGLTIVLLGKRRRKGSVR